MAPDPLGRSNGTPDRTECAPADVEMDPRALERALALVRGRGAAAQLYVVRHGKVVLDRALGCGRDSLFWIFSASKPYTELLVLQLAEAGLLGLDDPVKAHWAEFARGGKEAITVRHVLQHRTGLSAAGPAAVGDALAMTDWARSLRRIERARPRWPAGAVPAYSPLVSGFILGELVARVTARPVAELLRTTILTPLGAADTHLGLPDDQWSRHVPIQTRTPAGALVAAMVNRRATRRAVIPAAGISTTAADLAGFYLMLLNGGSHGVHRILPAETIAQARIPSSDGEVDRVAHSPIRWAQGFQLGGPRSIPGAVSPMGARSSVNTFGHNGSNCCIAWADPDRQLVVAYLTNRVDGGSADLHHHAAVADLILSACTDQPA